MVEKRQDPVDDDPYAQYYVVQKGDSLSKIAQGVLRRHVPVSEDFRREQGHPRRP